MCVVVCVFLFFYFILSRTRLMGHAGSGRQGVGGGGIVYPMFRIGNCGAIFHIIPHLPPVLSYIFPFRSVVIPCRNVSQDIVYSADISGLPYCPISFLFHSHVVPYLFAGCHPIFPPSHIRSSTYHIVWYRRQVVIQYRTIPAPTICPVSFHSVRLLYHIPCLIAGHHPMPHQPVPIPTLTTIACFGLLVPSVPFHSIYMSYHTRYHAFQLIAFHAHSVPHSVPYFWSSPIQSRSFHSHFVPHYILFSGGEHSGSEPSPPSLGDARLFASILGKICGVCRRGCFCRCRTNREHEKDAG